MSLTIFIPGVPSNSNRKGQWARHAASSERAKFRRRAAQAAEDHPQYDEWTTAEHPFTRVAARQVSPVRRRRDPLGLAERLKGIVDGLVDAGMMPDDDENHIEIHLNRSVKGPVAGIEITLTPVVETPA